MTLLASFEDSTVPGGHFWNHISMNVLLLTTIMSLSGTFLEDSLLLAGDPGLLAAAETWRPRGRLLRDRSSIPRTEGVPRGAPALPLRPSAPVLCKVLTNLSLRGSDSGNSLY